MTSAMQVMFRRTSLVLFAIVSLFLIWFGITYASVQDMLPFHAAAVPEAARDQVKPLYFALMRLIGASSASLGLLGLFVIIVPLRRGVPGSATLLLATNTIVFGLAAFTAVRLAATTAAPTSWHLMGIGLAVTFAALAAHAVSVGMRRAA